jgi:hypothetical protein
MQVYELSNNDDMSYVTKIAESNRTKDFIDRRIRWQCTIEYAKLSFQSLWNIVSTATRLNHSSNELYIDNVSEFAWLFKIIETVLFHCLSCDFVCYLINNERKIHGWSDNRVMTVLDRPIHL